MRKTLLLLTTMALALLVAGGVALADHLANTVQCDPTLQNGYCWGTEESDHMYGSTVPVQFPDQQVDIIVGFGGDDQVDALGNNDYVEGDEGNDTIYGGEGGDHGLWAGPGNDRVFGAAGEDYIWGQEGDDFVHGGPGNDLIENETGLPDVGAGKDQARGGGGNDIIFTGSHRDDGSSSNGDGYVDAVDCGSGTDTVHFEKGVDKINANCEIRKPYR